MENEIWKDIKGYEGEYQVSSTGRVRSLDRVIIGKRWKGVVLKQYWSHKKNGYLLTFLYQGGKGRAIKVHRLVASAFVANPENKPEVNHKDKDRTNNGASNLEWVTRGENAFHSWHSTDEPGRANRKLTKSQVVDIISSSASRQELSKKYGVSESHIRGIKQNRAWKHLERG